MAAERIGLLCKNLRPERDDLCFTLVFLVNKGKRDAGQVIYAIEYCPDSFTLKLRDDKVARETSQKSCKQDSALRPVS